MKKQTKEKTLPSTKPASSKKRKLKLVGVGLLVLFVVAQLLFDSLVIWRHSTTMPQSEPVIATTIFNSINGLYSPLPIEAQTGNLYAAEAHLKIPASNIKDVLYSYTPADGDVPATITFTTRNIIEYGKSRTVSAYYDSFTKSTSPLNRDEKAFLAFFAELPSLQACARGVQIYETAQPESDTLTDRGTKQLNDGRTLHFYIEKQCRQQSQLDELLGAVKYIESF